MEPHVNFFLKLKSVSARNTCSLENWRSFFEQLVLVMLFFHAFSTASEVVSFVNEFPLGWHFYAENSTTMTMDSFIMLASPAILMIVLFSVISLLLNWISALHQSTSHLVKINFRKRKSNRRQCQSVTPFQIRQIQFIAALLLQFQFCNISQSFKTTFFPFEKPPQSKLSLINWGN